MMKNILFVLPLLILIIFQTDAQIYAGPKMGPNSSKVPTTELYLPEGNKELLKAGLSLGAMANFGVNKLFSVQTEFLFSQKGYRDQWMQDSALVEESVNLNFLELFIMPRITLGGESIKGYVNAGPSFGYMLSGKITYVNQEDIKETKIAFDRLAQQNLMGLTRTDLSVNIGGGILLPAGGGNIVVDFRYGYGIIPIRKWIDNPVHQATWNNSVLSLTFGYLFKVK